MVPSLFSMSIYRLFSWARSTVIPLLVIRHYEPTYSLPNGQSKDNNFIDELWVDLSKKMAPYSPPVRSSEDNNMWSRLFTTIDNVLYWLGGLRFFSIFVIRFEVLCQLDSRASENPRRLGRHYSPEACWSVSTHTGRIYNR